MASPRKQPLHEFFLATDIKLNNSLLDPDILPLLTTVGYDEVKLNEGVNLYQQAYALHLKQREEYGKQYAATQTLYKRWSEADKVYMRALKFARIVFSNDHTAKTALFLRGARKRTITGWLDQAKGFYRNLINDETRVAKMLPVGYTLERLNAEQAIIAEVSDAHYEQQKEIGEAQEATKVRDQKVNELAEWISEFDAIARLALEDHPQWLEKLGIFIRS